MLWLHTQISEREAFLLNMIDKHERQYFNTY